MLVRKARRKLPRNAVESLMETCEWLSKKWGRPATEIFKGFLELMNKYADYFFSKPWAEKYDHDGATAFTDEDIGFLFEGGKKEFSDRYTTLCLKKNMSMEVGFMGYFGIYWTQQAFHEEFLRPSYKPVLEAFGKFTQGDEDAQGVLGKLKQQFDALLIHNSLVDLLEHEYPSKATRKLIGEIFELLHTVEGLAPCGDFRCDWYQNQKYPKSNSSG